jgi:hypothetical protein
MPQPTEERYLWGARPSATKLRRISERLAGVAEDVTARIKGVSPEGERCVEALVMANRSA